MTRLQWFCQKTVGFARRKGHEVKVEELSYRSGDQFQAAALGKSNQTAVFFDSAGRSYALAAHLLPSARGQGEPLTGKLNPPAGSRFTGLILDEPDQKYLIVSDAGYGFIGRVEDMISKNKAGKSYLSVPNGAQVDVASSGRGVGRSVDRRVYNRRAFAHFSSERIARAGAGQRQQID